MLHIYSGDGKGKTTCAYGLAMRCAGWGGRVVSVRFLKPNKSGELLAINLLPGARTICFERQSGFYHTLSADEKRQLREDIELEITAAETIVAGKEADLIILDEVIDAAELGLVGEDRLLRIADAAAAGDIELVMTGRRPSNRLAARADYHTDMLPLRHPYSKGANARKGIEF